MSFEAPNLDIRFLQPGDLLTLENNETNPPTSVAYIVESKLWTKLDITHTDEPQVILHGTLEGLLAPENQRENPARIFGSGLSDSAKTKDVVLTSRPPQYQVGSTGGGLFHGRLDDGFALLRKDAGGEYHNIEPGELAGKTFDMPVHNAREQVVREILNKLGYSEGHAEESVQPGFSSHRLRVSYKSDHQKGECLTLFDKMTGQWTSVQYCRTEKCQILKVGIAKLPLAATDWEGNQNRLPEAGDVAAQGVPIVTFISSPQLGLNGVSYLPKGDDGVVALSEFGVTPDQISGDGVSLYIDDDGTVQVDGLEQDHRDGPLLNPEISPSILITPGKEGKTRLEFGNIITAEIPDIDTHLEHLLHLVEKSSS